MKRISFLAVAITCWGVVLIGALANLAFNFNIPTRFLVMLGYLSLGVAVLTGTALLGLRKVAPGEGWGHSPLGLSFIGIGILSSRLYIGLEYAHDYQLMASLSIPSWNQILGWLRQMDLLRKASGQAA